MAVIHSESLYQGLDPCSGVDGGVEFVETKKSQKGPVRANHGNTIFNTCVARDISKRREMVCCLAKQGNTIHQDIQSLKILLPGQIIEPYKVGRIQQNSIHFFRSQIWSHLLLFPLVLPNMKVVAS